MILAIITYANGNVVFAVESTIIDGRHKIVSIKKPYHKK